MYHRVQFTVIGKGGFTGTDARRVVGKALDRHPSPEDLAVLFHHKGAGAPPIRFIGARGGFQVLALGEKACAVLKRLSADIAIGVSQAIRAPVTQSHAAGACMARVEPYALTYEVARIVGQKKPRHTSLIERDGKAFFRAMVERNLRSEALLHGLPLPETLDIDVLDYVRDSAVVIDNSRAAFGRYRLRFSVPLRLSGPWGIGHLLSHGYGNLNADLALAEHRALEQAA